MTNIIGREIELGVGLEAVRGTPTSPSRWAKKITANILPRTEKIVDESSFGRMEDSEGARIVRKWFDGDLEGIVHADLIGYFLANIYGSVATTGLGNSVYSHIFTLEQSVEHPSISIYRNDGGVETEKYGGGVVNTLEISATTDDFVKFTANIICGTGATSAETASYETEYDFIGRDITVKMADTEAGLSGAIATKIKELTISFDAKAISDFNLGSYNPDVYNAPLGIEVSFTRNYGDTTFEDLFKSNTYKYVQIEIKGEADMGGGNNPKITLLLNKAQVQSWERTGEANALVEENITMKAFYNVSDSQASELTLVNLTSSYVVGS